MKNFLKKMVNLALPKVRDFKGIKKKFDESGNYNLGLKDFSIFPEAEAVGGIDFFCGANISIVTTAKDAFGAKCLMEAFGFPFCRDE